MIEFGFERKINERQAAWAFTLGGIAFLVLVAGMAIAHFGFGVPINGEARKVPPSRDLMIFFPLALTLGGITFARGIRMLRRLGNSSKKVR